MKTNKLVQNPLAAYCCIALLSLGVAPSSLHANEEVVATKAEHNKEGVLKVLLGAGITFGGDDVAKANFTDGSSDKLYAGALIDIKAGGIVSLPSSPYEIQASVGYFFDSIAAENGDASFNRVPIEVLGFYRHEKHRFGLGLSYHTSVNLDLEGPSTDLNLDFKNAAGSVIEYGYEMSDRLVLAVRGVMIDYKLDEAGSISDDVDGNHLGVYAYLTF